MDLSYDFPLTEYDPFWNTATTPAYMAAGSDIATRFPRRMFLVQLTLDRCCLQSHANQRR